MISTRYNEADEIFIALGGTQKGLDHEYPVLAAEISYVKTKGKIERDIIALNFEHTHIFRPSMIMGKRKGNLLNYKGIEAKSIAKAMNNAAKHKIEKIKVYNWTEMYKINRSGVRNPNKNHPPILYRLGDFFMQLP